MAYLAESDADLEAYLAAHPSDESDVEAALAAGIFHRGEVAIEGVKEHLRQDGIETR